MHFSAFSLFILLLCVVVRGSYSMSDKRSDEIRYRLPNNTKPETYDITIVTNVDKNDFKFTGIVVIEIRVLEVSSNITLHARQLNIESVQLVSRKQGLIQLKPFTYDRTTEFLTIPTQTPLQRDTKYILAIDYSGELRSDQRGFYKTSYINSKGEIKWLATTHFEPTDARHAFPCYDEPALKAKFTIHIIHGESCTAVSNMKETRKPIVNSRVITDFDQTPLMSTYLIAFIISDFEYNEFVQFNVTNGVSTVQRVISRNTSQTSYALTEGIKIMSAIENYIEVPFPWPKLDQAAIPGSRVAAMENFGLITYPEFRLLFDPSIHLAYRQLNISATISHEISHHWFGNLVSPKWWSYLWLNEGFAIFFESLAVDLVHPQWNMWHNFIIRKVQTVLRDDAQPGTHPMTFYQENPTAIGSTFDSINYSKGGTVIRMFMHALGKETFKRGLNYYITNNTFGVADENTLFENLDLAAKEHKAIPAELEVKELFGSWSNQRGFPLLTVTRNYDDGSVHLVQERYSAELNQNDSTTWWIPFNFASAKDPIFDVTAPFGWLAKGQRDTVIGLDQEEISWTNHDWLIFNRQQTGYYRILYDDKNYNLIISELNDGNLEKIHPINRAQILDDLHEFVNDGRVSPGILCEILNYLKNETSYAPWETASKVIKEWSQTLQVSTKLQSFHTLISSLVEPYYEKFTLIETKDEEVFEKISRNTAVDLACEFGVQKCLEDTYSLFKEMINGKKLSPNIRGLAVKNGVRSASDDEIAKLWEVFLNSDDDDERKEIILSIGNIPEETTVEFYFNKAIGNNGRENISATERLLIVSTIIESSQGGVSLAMQLLSKKSKNVISTIGSLSPILNSIARRTLDTKMETEFYQLLESLRNGGMTNEKDMEIFKETAAKKLNWQKNNLISFENNFFQGKCKTNGAPQISTSATLFLFLMFFVLHTGQTCI